MLVIDLSVPRNIDLAIRDLKGVTLYDVPQEEQDMDQNLGFRRQSIRFAEEMINRE